MNLNLADMMFDWGMQSDTLLRALMGSWAPGVKNTENFMKRRLGACICVEHHVSQVELPISKYGSAVARATSLRLCERAALRHSVSQIRNWFEFELG